MGKYQVTIRTSDYRGDHSSDMSIPIDIPSDVKLCDLMDLIFEKNVYHLPISKKLDYIEIKNIITVEGK